MQHPLSLPCNANCAASSAAAPRNPVPPGPINSSSVPAPTPLPCPPAPTPLSCPPAPTPLPCPPAPTPLPCPPAPTPTHSPVLQHPPHCPVLQHPPHPTDLSSSTHPTALSSSTHPNPLSCPPPTALSSTTYPLSSTTTHCPVLHHLPTVLHHLPTVLSSSSHPLSCPPAPTHCPVLQHPPHCPVLQHPPHCPVHHPLSSTTTYPLSSTTYCPPPPTPLSCPPPPTHCPALRGDCCAWNCPELRGHLVCADCPVAPSSRGMCVGAWILLLLAAALYLFSLFRRCRRPNEPPLDHGLIPWLGHALEFGKDAANFLSRMKAKHGDIFTVQVAGKFVTVLLDPHSYDAVVWESSSKLDFGKYAQLLMERMFDVRLPSYDTAAEKALFKSHLQGKSLPSLTRTMLSNLNTILLSDQGSGSTEWEEAGLFHFTYSVMLRAGYLTLFGTESKQFTNPHFQGKASDHSEEVYNEFRKLDQLLMKTARSMLSPAEKKEATLVKGRLWHLLGTGRLQMNANRSAWLDHYQRHLEELHVNDDMQSKTMLLQLWATQGNAGPAAFWLLLFLLKHPEALAAVRGEAETLFKSKGQTIHEMKGISQEVLDSALIFDSVLNESLRLTTAPFITREVIQDMYLKLADGRGYLLRRGDRLCLFPYVSPQMDPEIHENPKLFQYDRFLHTDGTEKTDFYKSGKRLKNYNMPWGAGNNVCVGRFHAINSIKQFVFIMLIYFDFELRNSNEEIPEFDRSRYGFGVVQPENDIVFRYKRKR
ncbi:prostacyclin synthase [Ascaphus truei]|uniref:prostacyclin synthase n=1 Tax=Ascaphus truei TaxID=8439 RepID=UPI003F59E47B